jgi:hypothetical protein
MGDFWPAEVSERVSHNAAPYFWCPGTDSVKVWDLRTMRELGSPKSPEMRGASTAFVWIKREDDLSEALFYGTQNSYLVCWKKGKLNLCTMISRLFWC